MLLLTRSNRAGAGARGNRCPLPSQKGRTGPGTVAGQCHKDQHGDPLSQLAPGRWPDPAHRGWRPAAGSCAGAPLPGRPCTRPGNDGGTASRRQSSPPPARRRGHHRPSGADWSAPGYHRRSRYQRSRNPPRRGYPPAATVAGAGRPPASPGRGPPYSPLAGQGSCPGRPPAPPGAPRSSRAAPPPPGAADACASAGTWSG
mmetsp:Transcript_9001/g.25214  ORF Transcript_9001/g.25214 Transcript_9001/m.25214 type:complete len:201 (+) Transcript_9001:435-1037(+)